MSQSWPFYKQPVSLLGVAEPVFRPAPISDLSNGPTRLGKGQDSAAYRRSVLGGQCQ